MTGAAPTARRSQPVSFAGHHRRPPDTAAIDMQMIQALRSGTASLAAADCAVEYRAGLRRGGHHHLQP